MKTKSALVVVGILGLVAWGIASRLKPSSEEAKKAPAEQAVGVVAIKVQDVPVLIDVNGSVVSLKTVEVRAQASNLIEKIHVKEGQFVRQGETLFSLDDRADRANFEKIKAQLQRDRALGADLERQFRRAEELKAQNYVSQSAVDTTFAQREAQTALIKSDEAALAVAQVALEYDTIRAPLSGRLGGINVFPGTLVQPSSPALVTVTQLDPVSVQFNIPESSLQSLQAALKEQQGKANVRVRIPSGGDELQGSLYFVDNVVDSSSGTIKAKAQFANPKHLLWPGQFVQTRIELATLKEAITIPAAAVITNLSGKFVYAVNEDSTVQSKPVTVRHLFGDSMVVDGLNANDKVVTDGKQNLRAGGKIRVVSPPPPKPDAPAAKTQATAPTADASKP